MPTPSDEHLRKLLAQAERDLIEAGQRRNHQADVVSSLREETETRAFAEVGLSEIDRTVAFIRSNQALIQTILS